MKKNGFVRLTAILLACILLAGCGTTAPNKEADTALAEKNTAQAAQGDSAIKTDKNVRYHIEEHSYPTYLLDLDTELTEPFPLCFMDGVDDLPYVALAYVLADKKQAGLR